MKPTHHTHWGNSVIEAEQNLAKNLPTVYALRNAEPEWRNTWPQHRSLQITELHEFCLATMPKVILELGSGYTTFVLARYASEFSARLVSVEEKPTWAGWVQKHLPWSKSQYWFSPVTTTGETRYYEQLPPDMPEIDLLYVDGPNCDAFNRSLTGCDAVRLVQSGVRPKHVLFDMRHNAVDLFRREVDCYGFEPGGSYELAKPWYLRACRHHSWFWRK